MKRTLATLLSLILAAGNAAAGGLAVAPVKATIRLPLVGRSAGVAPKLASSLLAPSVAPLAAAPVGPSAQAPAASAQLQAVAAEPGREAEKLAEQADGTAEAEPEDLVPGGAIPLIPGVSGVIHQQYVDPVSRAKLHRAALRGMVVKSGRGREPGVAVYFKQLAQAEEKSPKGVDGLGMQIFGDGTALVTEVDPASELGKAGLRTGDVIVGVDGSSLVGIGWRAAREAFAELFQRGGQVVVDRPSGKRGLYLPRPNDELIKFFESAAVMLGTGMTNAIERLGTAALTAMGASLDRFTAFYGPKTHAASQEQMEGDYQGIGVMLDVEKDRVGYIHEVTAGTPAERAGLKAGDKILEVAGQPVSGTDVKPFIAAIRAQGDAAFMMAVDRGGVRVEVEVRREAVAKRLAAGRMAAPGVGYVNLTLFAEDAAQQVREELRRLKKEGATKFVLDLRFNGGGRADEAVSMAELFLPRGRKVYSQRDRERDQPHITGNFAGEFASQPLVVLVNRHSASASEIIAAAMQDHGRAAVVGDATFGKGSGQFALPMPYGTELHLTTFRWYTPKGRNVEGRGNNPAGVQPDVLAPSPADGEPLTQLWVAMNKRLYGLETDYQDAQLAAALEVLQAK